MKDSKISYGWIITFVVIVILFIPIIVDYVNSQKISNLTGETLKEKIALKENFLLYVGEVSKDVKKELKSIKDIEKNDYSLPYNVYSIDKNEAFKDIIDDDVKVILVINGDVQKEYNSYKFNEIRSDVERLVVGNITSDNASYKVAPNFKAYKSLVKSKDLTVAVFGRASCYHCNNYKLVYNAVAEKYNVDIYYFDSDNYNAEQYNKIINMDLTVPAKCSSTGAEFKLADGFGTPLTIITKKDKIVDCISGYVERTTLVKVLKDNKVISE